jgi:hypothetical protein
MQWVQRYNGTGNEFDGADRIVLDTAGNVYVTGRSRGSGGSDDDCVTIKYSQSLGVNQISSEIPEKFSLSQNYPNPFNPSTKISFAIPSYVKSEMSNVKIIIYDVLGREVQILVDENLSPGTYEIDFDGSNLPSGVYYYVLTSSDFTQTKKMVLIK